MAGPDDAPRSHAAGVKGAASPRWGLRVPGAPWGREWLHHLDAEDRARLTVAQVAATRPAFTAVLLGGAVMLAIAAALQAGGLAPGIGYPAWLVLCVAVAVALLAWLNLHVRQWGVRLVAMLLATALTGVFLSLPVPGAPGAVVEFPIRTGLFH